MSMRKGREALSRGELQGEGECTFRRGTRRPWRLKMRICPDFTTQRCGLLYLFAMGVIEKDNKPVQLITKTRGPVPVVLLLADARV